MKRSQVNEKLRRLAQQEIEAIRPDERHRAMTAALAQNAYKAAAPRRNKMRFPAFVLRQVRYTGKQIWIWQILLLLLIVSAFEQTGDRGSLTDPYFLMFLYRRIPVLLCGAGILSAWSCVPFFDRAVRWKMAEVEAAGCQPSRLRAARLLIAGSSALIMELAVAVAAGTLWQINLEALAAWLFLPFLLSWNCMLFLFDRTKGRFTPWCSAAMAAGFAVFVLVWRYVSRAAGSPGDFLAFADGGWLLCGAALLLWAFQIWKQGRKEMERWSYV